MPNRLILSSVFLFLIFGHVARGADDAANDVTSAELREAIEAASKKVDELQAQYEHLQTLIERQKQEIVTLIQDKNTSPSKPVAGTEDKPTNGPIKATWHWNVNATTITYTAMVRSGARVTLTHNNKLRTFGTFTNKSKVPLQFSMRIMIYKQLAFPVRHPPILGSGAFTTPVLKPGQSVSINTVVGVSDVNVNRRVRIIDVEPILPKK